MATEDKAKRYDEAIEKAKNCLKDGTITNTAISYIETIFPELRESEDEKIRKGIIHALHGDGFLDMEETNKAISWLEKQGEKKQDPCDNCKDVMLNCHNFPCVKKRAFKQGKSVLEAIIDEKVDNANKVETKFKDGDWVILTVGDWSYTLQIVNVDTNKKLYRFNDNSYLPIVKEKCLRLWTIQDAKDGDVLACYNKVNAYPFIFHNLTEELNPSSYCGINSLGEFQDNDENGGYWCLSTEKCYPATKEQRDTLMKAMADAGYSFDFDKKKLKKIVAPKFKIGDTMRTLQEASNGITSGLPVVVSIDNEYYHCNNELIAIKDQDNYEYPPMNRRQKPVDNVEPFDKYEGLTDFERTLADICIGWIGEEPGWEQYINDGADVLLKIAIKKFNSVQEQNPAWSVRGYSFLEDKQMGMTEYTRTDAFIEKACAWLKESITNNPECNRILSKKGVITMGLLIEDFINYMKGE